jgi:hypothetical protein
MPSFYRFDLQGHSILYGDGMCLTTRYATVRDVTCDGASPDMGPCASTPEGTLIELRLYGHQASRENREQTEATLL